MERFNLYCNAALRANTFDNLQSICDAMDGNLTWFDTQQELNALMPRFDYYDHETDPYDAQIHTGIDLCT